MIETERLRIIPCDDTIFDAIKMGDGVLATVLGCNVPRKWTEFRPSLKLSYKYWLEHPEAQDWWTHLIVAKKENTLIGTCGFKGEPTGDKEVEIGYEIKETHRNKGYATEATKALVQYAYESGLVEKVLAFTTPFETSSTSVLKKVGFTQVNGIQESAEGLVWKWEHLKK